MSVAGRGFCNSFWIFFFVFLKKKTNLFRGNLCNWFHLCPKRGVFPLWFAHSQQVYSPRAWGGGGSVCWHQADIRQLVCGFAGPLPPLFLLQLCLFLTLPCPYFTFPPWIPGVMLGRAQPGRGQGKAIRLLAQPTSPGPLRGEWAGAETQPGALLDGGRALWRSCTAHFLQG